MIQKLTTISDTILCAVERDAQRWFLILLAITTLVRIGLLFISDVNLGPDETQYWFWSLTPEFGYFSKPPMIAWIINLTTNIFGHEEWAIRLSAPLLHSGSALFLYVLGSLLYQPKTGFWIGTGWLLLPGVAFSSALITTDVPMLFFWSGAMLFQFRMMTHLNTRKHISYSDIISFGLCLGLGFLSKYAMVYFLIAMAISLILIPTMRQKELLKAFAISIGIMILCIIPNIIWNAGNDFQTISHTAANANWQGTLFKPIKLLEFWAAQFGIIGPILLSAFLVGLFLKIPVANSTSQGQACPQITPTQREYELMLIIIALTPLIIVSIQSFISRAHANWAVASYPAITILAIAWLFRLQRPRLLVASHSLHLVLAVALATGLSSFTLIDKLGLSAAIKPVRGWEVHGQDIAAVSTGYDAVMADDRELSGEILYYGNIANRGKDTGRPFIAWNSNNRIDDHYEAFLPFKPNLYPRLLYITSNRDAVGARHMFEIVNLVETSTVDLKNGRERTLYFFSLGGFRG